MPALIILEHAGVLAGESGPVMSGMKKVARSRGTRLAASLDTGAVLSDLLQTVAPVTPTGMGLPFPTHLQLYPVFRSTSP